mgnify:CR=1 FL=1
MKKLSQSLWFNILVILTLTAFGLVIALYDSYTQAINTLLSIPFERLVLIMMYGLLQYLVWGYILMIMARQIDPKYRYLQGLTNAFVGGFMAGITPSSTGGQVVQISTYKRHGLTTFQGAGLIWMDYFMYSVALVVLTLFLFIIQFKYFESASITFIFGLGLLINLLIILVLGLMVKYPHFAKKTGAWVIQKITDLPFIKHKDEWLNQYYESIEHFHEAMFAVHESKDMLWMLFGLNILRLLLFFSAPIMIAFITGIQFDISDWFHLFALAAFVHMANTFVPLPGASGATESVFVLSFSTVIGKAAAASTMILWRFSTFHLVLLIGGMIYLSDRHKHLVKIKKEQLNEENSH